MLAIAYCSPLQLNISDSCTALHACSHLNGARSALLSSRLTALNG